MKWDINEFYTKAIKLRERERSTIVSCIKGAIKKVKQEARNNGVIKMFPNLSDLIW